MSTADYSMHSQKAPAWCSITNQLVTISNRRNIWTRANKSNYMLWVLCRLCLRECQREFDRISNTQIMAPTCCVFQGHGCIYKRSDVPLYEIYNTKMLVHFELSQWNWIGKSFGVDAQLLLNAVSHRLRRRPWNDLNRVKYVFFLSKAFYYEGASFHHR